MREVSDEALEGAKDLRQEEMEAREKASSLRAMSGILKATYRTWCPECHNPVERGDEIVRAEEGRYKHVNCPEPADPLPKASRDEFLCSKCYLIHKKGACVYDED